MTSQNKKIFLFSSILAPFILYCVYYYHGMLARAPFRFKEFESFSFQYGTKDSLLNKYDSKTGDYQYLNAHDSLVKKTLRLSVADLDSLHKNASLIGFWDFPIDERNNSTKIYPGRKPIRYIITFNYKRKSKKVVFDTNYPGDQRLIDANKNFIADINAVLNRAEERQKK